MCNYENRGLHLSRSTNCVIISAIYSSQIHTRSTQVLITPRLLQVLINTKTSQSLCSSQCAFATQLSAFTTPMDFQEIHNIPLPGCHSRILKLWTEVQLSLEQGCQQVIFPLILLSSISLFHVKRTI